jgi:hypothetical protein
MKFIALGLAALSMSSLAHAGGVVIACAGGAKEAITQKKPQLAELIIKLKEETAPASSFSSGETTVSIGSFTDDYGNSVPFQALEDFTSEGGEFKFDVAAYDNTEAPHVGDLRYIFRGIRGCNKPATSSGKVYAEKYAVGIAGWTRFSKIYDCYCLLTTK